MELTIHVRERERVCFYGISGVFNNFPSIRKVIPSISKKEEEEEEEERGKRESRHSSHNSQRLWAIS